MSLNPSETAAKQVDARKEAAGTSEEDQSLDPAFPYVVIKFDPTVFGKIADSTSAN
jgi:hypothetical protein